jgi:hypothetical protein
MAKATSAVKASELHGFLLQEKATTVVNAGQVGCKQSQCWCSIPGNRWQHHRCYVTNAVQDTL